MATTGEYSGLSYLPVGSDPTLLIGTRTQIGYTTPEAAVYAVIYQTSQAIAVQTFETIFCQNAEKSLIF